MNKEKDAAAVEEEQKPVQKRGCPAFVKRALDILASVLLLAVLGWFILICMLIKWCEDFYNPVGVTRRVGKNGKEYNLFEIRTVCPYADELKEQLIKAGLNEAEAPDFKMENDPRVTKIGKTYKKYHIDKTLSLLNVIAGHLSLAELFSK